eukprot:1431993-Pyramimonas_sp.AAC.1
MGGWRRRSAGGEWRWWGRLGRDRRGLPARAPTRRWIDGRVSIRRPSRGTPGPRRGPAFARFGAARAAPTRPAACNCPAPPP